MMQQSVGPAEAEQAGGAGAGGAGGGGEKPEILALEAADANAISEVNRSIDRLDGLMESVFAKCQTGGRTRTDGQSPSFPSSDWLRS